MAETFPRLDFLEVWQSAATEIVKARADAITIHHATNIDAAGDEVEMAVRAAIRSKLPVKYHTGYGHLIDYAERVSPQYDVIISDLDSSPIFFRSKNGTEYFTYESVYCIGEIKSTYYKSKRHIEKFCDNVKQMKQRLQRQRVPLSKIIPTERLKLQLSSASGSDYLDIESMYKNPLFSFMFFVDSGDFELDQVAELYRTRPLSELPNVICLLDKGLLVNMHFFQTPDGSRVPVTINPVPEFNNKSAEPRHAWSFMCMGEEKFRSGSNFAVFYYLLFEHLRASELSAPSMAAYLMRMLMHREGWILGD